VQGGEWIGGIVFLAFVGWLAILVLTPYATKAPAIRRGEPSWRWFLMPAAYGAYLLVLVMMLLVASTGRENLREDGECGTFSGWASDHPGELTVERLDFPPLARRCVVEGPEGRFEKVFPTAPAYLMYVILALIPFGAWSVARRRSRVRAPA
jgi:hypothetical protein